MMITKTAPAPEHLEYLAANLKASDIEEINAASGLEPLECLQASVKISRESYVAVLEGKPCFVYGVEGDRDNYSIWLLGTPEAGKYPLDFMEFCRAELKRLINKYGRLMNIIPEKNLRTVSWLKALGAKIDDAKVKIVNSEDNYRFFMFGGAELCAHRRQ
jgi:hypothetical protein